MNQLLETVDTKFKKKQVVDVKSGDTVRIHQKIKEGSKERIQVFEGLVIRTRRKNSLMSSVTVRRIASGVGVEKTFVLHSPLLSKVEVVKRSKVRRNYLSYMRNRSGKSARLSGVDFDKDSVNELPMSVEEQQNVDAGLDKDASMEEIESEAGDKTGSIQPTDDSKEDDSKDEKDADKSKDGAEVKKEEDSDKADDKDRPSDEPSTDAQETDEDSDKTKKLSKEEKAKLKKEKAKAFQEEHDK